MESNNTNCSSCKKNVTNLKGTTTFMCPSCNKGKIVRCKECRVIAAKYTCSECGFTGPN
jgi:Zn-ribbon RNA-binding protein